MAPTPAKATATVSSSEPPKIHASHIGSIKAFAEANGVGPIPSSYHSITEPRDDVAHDLAASIPVIDFSLLTSHHDPRRRAFAVRQLGKACADWGFFMITNHGISETLMEQVINKSHEFHNLPIEEKKEFADNKGPFTPIRHGTSFHPQSEKVHYWRDYLKVLTHPQFNFPHKPYGFKEVAYEYCEKIREIARNLIEAISESLGLEAKSLVEYTGFDRGLTLMAVNLYPACPEPELALGMPPHSDHGLLTVLIQNGIGGLQVMQGGRWVNVDPLPNCLVVNTGDQLEAVSNGRYRSVVHRAVLNNRDTRISVAVANGPELEKEIGPAPELVEKEEEALFKCTTYSHYFQIQQQSRLSHKSALDQIRINPQN
ncbi:flavanone 3-dioxygenase 2-like [Senna tora]|uniref:Flavanone 3-dioxygenase 2-like n=1 Tax=Senna tora TaxID=362788 RepID=A0A834TY42_9FABA|nr:flavanone 3-dioxygenase 2-like [Senna tora]